MSITLDPAQAKQGSGGSKRIDTTGKYKGKIKHCKTWATDAGAIMTSLAFESDSGEEARINSCIMSKDGNPTFGMKQLQALMACCKIRELTESQVTMEDYNPDSGQVEAMQRTVYTELSGANIGLALYRHDQDKYRSPTESTFAMEVAAPFNYETEQTAKEVLDQAPPKQLEKIVSNLSDKDSRKQSAVGGNHYSGPMLPSDMPEPPNDFDDLPF